MAYLGTSVALALNKPLLLSTYIYIYIYIYIYRERERERERDMLIRTCIHISVPQTALGCL